MPAAGRAWVFGDDIDTDVIAPGLYMKGSIEELAQHCLESIDPEFASSVATGDVVVGGENFGIGSSREQAVLALKTLGVRTLVSKSFAGIFFRNALNLGMVALTCSDAGRIRAGERISADPAKGEITNHSTGETYVCDALPDHLLSMVLDGGLVEHLRKRPANKAGPT